MKSWIFLFILSSVLMVKSITIDYSCHPKTEWKSEWLGSNASIRTWIEETADALSHHFAKNLTIHYTFKGYKKTMNYDLITIHRSGVEIIKMRNGSNTMKNENFSEPLGIGWQEFRLTSSTSATELWHQSVKLVSVEKEFSFSELTVDGSNVTGNCPRNELQWFVTSREQAIIPANFEQGTQTVSFYSNSKFYPKISLTESKFAILGWNGSSIMENETIASAHRGPLPEATEHRVSISCKKNGHRILCAVETEQNSGVVKNLYVRSMPSALHVSTESDGKIVVLLYLPQTQDPEKARGPVLTTPSETSTMENESNNNEIPCIVTISVLLLVLLFLGPTVWYFYRRSTSRRNKYESVQPDEPDSNSCRLSFTTPVKLSLWGAVEKNDVRLVEDLLNQGVDPYKIEEDRHTTAYMGAHILGYTEILQVMQRYRARQDITFEDLIKNIILELRNEERGMFEAARSGRYSSPYNGVETLLKKYSFPVTISDKNGRSFIHYVASASSENGLPAWRKEEISLLLSNPEHYINAVDFQGNTALHCLASRPKNSNENAQFRWNGPPMTLENIWLDMAKLFLNHCSDPRIANHLGVLANEIATDNGHHELAVLLEKKCEELGETDLETTHHFEELVDAARKGETLEIISLLNRGVPLLPVYARADPLVEAIRYNRRNTVILLIGAGAPLANQNIGNVTPLEAAHTTAGSLAIIPALVYCDRLRDEGSRIILEHADTMKAFMNSVITAGWKAKWEFNSNTGEEETNKEAQELLLQAVEKGCYLFCQVLSQEDVHLHSPNKESNAFCKAVENKQVHTQLSLCRDLRMSPMTFTSSALESLNKDLRKCILNGQFRILRNTVLYGRLKINNEECKQILDIWEHKKSTEIVQPPDTLLYTIVQKGLDVILYVLMTKCKSFDINKEIDFSKSTLLHVAAMNGQINMIEFLLFRKAKLDLVTVGGYTAAHLAALGGHKEALLYIEEHTKKNKINVNVECKCQVGLTPSELMANYSTVCKSLTLPVMSHEDALTVMNAKTNSEKAYEILKRKGEALNITNPQALFDCVEKNTLSSEDMICILKTIREEVGKICNGLKNSDFGGNLSLMGPLQEETEIFTLQEETEIFNVSDVHFTLELEAFHCLDHTATVTYEEKANNNLSTFVLRHNSKPELFKGTNFIWEFSKAMETALLSYKSSPDEISLCSPFLTTRLSEVSFCLLLKKDEYFIKIAVHVLPVIAISFPKENRIKEGYEEYIKSNNGKAQICLLNSDDSDGEWIFHPHLFEKYIFQNLNESQRKVRTACHLISKLLNPWPWAPPFRAKHFIRPWHTLSVGVEFLQPEAVNSLFLKECTKNSSPWTDDTVFQKLLSLYQHAAEKDSLGTWTVHETIESSIFLRVYYENYDSVCGVIRYLEYLKNERDHT
ncbi:uncharacterized protein LOC135201052 isoform X2 [Macrobrachium nipponense]|uniref:uncharacterized protein LOC135201052 isoform X2 n=1 Tax=Macrobrachium nipponense TaxID=159736 RepID=UPI0030C8847E